MSTLFIDVGYSYDTPAGLLDQVLRARDPGEDEDVEIRPRSLGTLAGENDLIQLISNNWHAIVSLYFFAKFILARR